MSKPTTTASIKAYKEAQKKRQQNQQYIGMGIVAVAAIALAILAIATLTPKTGVIVNSDQYSVIPSGLTRTGPNANVIYPYDVPYLGSPDAPVKIEEIGSFSCPICMAYHDQIFVNLIDEIQAGKLQYIFLPTTETGDYDAVPGTIAGYCAAQQGKFWAMHDRLYSEQAAYGATAAALSHINADATALGLDSSKFSTCRTDPASQQYVQTANNYANDRGLVGTPSIFLYVNGQQITPAAQSPNETKGSMAQLSVATLRSIIETKKVS